MMVQYAATMCVLAVQHVCDCVIIILHFCMIGMQYHYVAREYHGAFVL